LWWETEEPRRGGTVGRSKRGGGLVVDERPRRERGGEDDGDVSAS
jgi:hypothetical protein